MMTSKSPDEIYVWIFLPGKTDPVVAGRAFESKRGLLFQYGRSYLDRSDAVPIFDMELPLHGGVFNPNPGLDYPGCLRDGSPDAWGRRVIINQNYHTFGDDIDDSKLDEMFFMLESGSDRIGALDFQRSATHYEPRNSMNVSLDELAQSAGLVENGKPLSPALSLAIQFGTPIGGARPKALIDSNDKKYIAKFSSSNDLHGFVKGEYIAMTLAKACGLSVANVELKTALNKDVLLVERFDRFLTNEGWGRHRIVSALTVLGLGEMTARYASYEDLAEKIKMQFHDPRNTLEELFSRLTFNILSGNTDDHARNHAAIINGGKLMLSPAYDICPQSRVGQESSQGMQIWGGGNLSQLSLCLDACSIFGLDRRYATLIILDQIETIGSQWIKVCDDASFSDVDRSVFWGNQFLNPFATDGLTGHDKIIKQAADDIRETVRVNNHSECKPA